jgi:hypothetical protein
LKALREDKLNTAERFVVEWAQQSIARIRRSQASKHGRQIPNPTATAPNKSNISLIGKIHSYCEPLGWRSRIEQNRRSWQQTFLPPEIIVSLVSSHEYI